MPDVRECLVHDVIPLSLLARSPCAARGARTSFCLSRASRSGAAPRPCHGRRAYALNSTRFTLVFHRTTPRLARGALSLAARGSNRFFLFFSPFFFCFLFLSLFSPHTRFRHVAARAVLFVLFFFRSLTAGDYVIFFRS